MIKLNKFIKTNNLIVGKVLYSTMVKACSKLILNPWYITVHNLLHTSQFFKLCEYSCKKVLGWSASIIRGGRGRQYIILSKEVTSLVNRHKKNRKKMTQLSRLIGIGLGTRSVHTSCSTSVFNPWFLIGFIDGEGSFTITIYKDKEYSIGWHVQAMFQIHLHVKDLPLLKQIQSFFGCGAIQIIESNNSAIYRVTNLKDLIGIIIPFLDKYPLLSQKRADFELFKSAVKLMENREHLTREGLLKIVSIKASINRGLSDSLKESFPDVIPVNRPKVETTKIPDPAWISGFSSGESCFDIVIANNNSKLNYQTKLRFRITQHVRDRALLGLISKYLNCGRFEDSRDTVGFCVTKFLDISNIIIPFFEKYPIQGNKALDFQDFYRVVLLVRDKAHLTASGLDQIIKIKSKINSKRDEK